MIIIIKTINSISQKSFDDRSVCTDDVGKELTRVGAVLFTSQGQIQAGAQPAPSPPHHSHRPTTRRGDHDPRSHAGAGCAPPPTQPHPRRTSSDPHAYGRSRRPHQRTALVGAPRRMLTTAYSRPWRRLRPTPDEDHPIPTRTPQSRPTTRRGNHDPRSRAGAGCAPPARTAGKKIEDRTPIPNPPSINRNQKLIGPSISACAASMIDSYNVGWACTVCTRLSAVAS